MAADEVADSVFMDETVSDEASGEPLVRLVRWTGPWPEDDRDANFKQEIADYSKLDPLETVRGMSESIDVPVGAVVRYVLARWATGGSAGLLEVGPEMVGRLLAPIEAAEAAGTPAARLEAYQQVSQMLRWLDAPLQSDTYYVDDAHGE